MDKNAANQKVRLSSTHRGNLALTVKSFSTYCGRPQTHKTVFNPQHQSAYNVYYVKYDTA